LLFPVNSRFAAGEISGPEPGTCPVVKGTMMSILKRLLIGRPLKFKVGNHEKSKVSHSCFRNEITTKCEQ